MRVRDVMSRDLVVVTPDLSLRNLIELLAERHIGGAPVVAGERVVGVVTLDDLLTFTVVQPGVPTERPEDRDWEQETEPGVEGEEAPGAWFTDTWADVGAELVERFEALRSPEWDLLSEHTVGEIMTRRLLSVRPGDDVARAAALMRDTGVHRLLVMDEDRLAGIITTSDLARVLAEQSPSRA